MKILMVASEAAPFIKTGGLGDVVGSLPKELTKLGVDVRVVIPKYQAIPLEYREKMKYIGHKYIPLGWRNQYLGIQTLKYDGVTFYFIDNEYYFNGDYIYGDYDMEKFAFLSKATLEMLPMIDFYPDVIHCHDWQTAVIPVLWEAIYRNIKGYEKIKTTFTIHNLKFQGVHNKEFVNSLLGIP